MTGGGGYHLKARIEFDDGMTSEISCKVQGLGAYDVGEALPFRYDPTDRSEIASDERTTMFKIGWKQGQATVVARETHEGQYRRGINSYAPTGLYHHVYDYVADVEPDDGGPPFRARFVEMFESDTERRPLVGQTARVKFNPKSQETAFDRDALWKEAEAEKQADREAFDSIAEDPVGTSTAKPGLAGEVARQIEEKLREEGK